MRAGPAGGPPVARPSSRSLLSNGVMRALTRDSTGAGGLHVAELSIDHYPDAARVPREGAPQEVL